jgi:hypothetical protein
MLPEECLLVKVVRKIFEDNPFFATSGRMLATKYNFPLWYHAPDGIFDKVHLLRFWHTQPDLELDIEWIISTLRLDLIRDENLFRTQFAEASVRDKEKRKKRSRSKKRTLHSTMTKLTPKTATIGERAMGRNNLAMDPRQVVGRKCCTDRDETLWSWVRFSEPDRWRRRSRIIVET